MLVQQFLVYLLTAKVASQSQDPNSSNCTRKCGSVSIPYPFGTTADCSLDDPFLITCDQSSSTPTPLLQADNKTVLDISLDGELRISHTTSQDCYDDRGQPTNSSSYSMLQLSHFSISSGRNKFVQLGCDTNADLFGWHLQPDRLTYYIGISSFCISADQVPNKSCNGFGCSEKIISEGGLRAILFNADSMKNHTEVRDFNPCGHAFVVEDKAYNFSFTDLSDFNRKTVPIVLDWAVGDQTCQEAKPGVGFACKAEHSECFDAKNGIGYLCKCSSGFRGNPYLLLGCVGIVAFTFLLHSCSTATNILNCGILLQRHYSVFSAGVTICLLILLVGSVFVYLELKKRKLIAFRKQAFQKNGGILLQQQIAKDKDLVETAKIFTEKELRKATNNFDESMVLGQGGTGTVYRGVLSDNKVVAIKKSKIVDQKPVVQFINEVIVLSQINHRNVVKLLGCCLETQVPLLVYEFVTNGTLSDHLHNESQSCQLSWTIRLRVATETAGALAYLHSATSTPIIHRDVKTTNILLDDNLIAKVSDFGASKLVPLNKTQVTTLVQGTLGYLDPEYFQTSKLTEKSDVYSFGVVLTELLTSKKALSFERPENERNLATHFVSSIREGCLLQILDNSLVNHKNTRQLKEVANLAEECLRVKGEERPTMKEVALELERIRIMDTDPWERDYWPSRIRLLVKKYFSDKRMYF
ncbi:hypothetical protein L6164_030423 [Bauhinia variegata]|uniref:Uncharacterized protein n=1 Tax=Bauhinia variegata TaxID=167791 RepID=A0ACB9LCR3_BAUVA|nr:hypothetical protein L6164_030423 [Bauhinia variegata]